MVSAGISWNGKTRIHFIETGSVKVNAVGYVTLLKYKLLPDIEAFYPDGEFILQQDGATSHSSNLCQEYLKGEGIRFIEKNFWPPNSPDLNPMDYGIWSQLGDAVFKGRMSRSLLQS